MMIRSFVSFACLLVIFGASAACADTSRKQLEISFELKASTISLHEPVILLFKVHNGLDQRVTLNLGVNWVQFFQFSLTSQKGSVIQGRPQRNDGLSSQPAELVLGSGDNHEQELLLNQWFDFDGPGRYSLKARLSTPISYNNGDNLQAGTSLLALEIMPRSRDRLEKVCAELLSQVVAANGGEAEQKPLLKLSYINDPVAVPYLKEVLSQHRINYALAISGLEKIGNGAAVEALLATLGDGYADMSDLARQSLMRIQDRISDPNLRETVKRELALKRG